MKAEDYDVVKVIGRGAFGEEMHGDYLMSAGPGIVVKLTKYISANMYWGVPIGKRLPDYANNTDRRLSRFHFTLTSNIL